MQTHFDFVVQQVMLIQFNLVLTAKQKQKKKNGQKKKKKRNHNHNLIIRFIWLIELFRTNKIIQLLVASSNDTIDAWLHNEKRGNHSHSPANSSLSHSLAKIWKYPVWCEKSNEQDDLAAIDSKSKCELISFAFISSSLSSSFSIWRTSNFQTAFEIWTRRFMSFFFFFFVFGRVQSLPEINLQYNGGRRCPTNQLPHSSFTFLLVQFSPSISPDLTYHSRPFLDLLHRRLVLPLFHHHILHRSSAAWAVAFLRKLVYFEQSSLSAIVGDFSDPLGQSWSAGESFESKPSLLVMPPARSVSKLDSLVTRYRVVPGPKSSMRTIDHCRVSAVLTWLAFLVRSFLHSP